MVIDVPTSKWWANVKRSPSRPASCAENPLDPSRTICGVDVIAGVARNRCQAPWSRRRSPSMPIRSMSSAGKSSAPRPLGSRLQRRGSRRVGARRPPDAKVDPPGMERLQHGELLGDDKRWMVRQHHPLPTRSGSGDVTAARWAISTGGDVLAIVGMSWCSATQKRS